MILNNRLRALFNPPLYHGWGRSRRFFEGWYYKIVSKNQKHAFAFIPGVAMDENGKKQAFIQVLDGKNLSAKYHKFNFEDFIPNSKIHHVRISKNIFKSDCISLELPEIEGELIFEKLSPWSNSIFSPGIMGPFSFVPFMECYHGILSMNHTIKGKLKIKSITIDFTGGKGYIEKDWGHSFPEGYIWMQCNNFKKENFSVKASVAKIPWLKSSFIGFISGVLIDGELIEFTTYNSSKLLACKVTDSFVLISLENPKFNLDIKLTRKKPTKLVAPISGFMDSRVEECMDGKMEVFLKEKKTNNIILNDIGYSAAVEVAGSFEQLIK